MSQLASLVHRVHNRTRPANPIAMKIFDDQAKKPRALDKMKNIFSRFPALIRRVKAATSAMSRSAL